MPEQYEAIRAELWRQHRDEIGALKAEGETWPVLFILDGTDRRLDRLVRRLVDDPQPDEVPGACLLCVRDHATAREAMEQELALGRTIDDPNGADPDNGFWLVIAFGRYVAVALTTVRNGKPFTVRHWETTLPIGKEGEHRMSSAMPFESDAELEKVRIATRIIIGSHQAAGKDPQSIRRKVLDAIKHVFATRGDDLTSNHDEETWVAVAERTLDETLGPAPTG